jgi:hypothetical protein
LGQNPYIGPTFVKKWYISRKNQNRELFLYDKLILVSSHRPEPDKFKIQEYLDRVYTYMYGTTVLVFVITFRKIPRT